MLDGERFLVSMSYSLLKMHQSLYTHFLPVVCGTSWRCSGQSNGLTTKRSWVLLLAVFLSYNNSEQLIHTCVPVSPSSIICYWSKNDLRFTICFAAEMITAGLAESKDLSLTRMWFDCLETAISFVPNS